MPNTTWPASTLGWERRKRHSHGLAERPRNGFPSYPVYEQDPFLEPIRDAIGFRGLVDELRDERRGYAEVYGELAAARRRDSCPA